MRDFKLKVSKLKSIGIVLILTVLAGCASSDDADSLGGISGTGKLLKGTVHNNRMLASNAVQIKSIGNPVVTAGIDSQGEYSIAELPEAASYLLRVDFTSGAPFYALTTTGDGRQNIHAYSDLAIRNWYASQGLNVSDAFDGTTEIIPTPEQMLAQADVINSLLETVLAEYGLSNVDLFTAEYRANDLGVDGFLDNNPVIIVEGNINIIVTNPTTNFQTPLTTNLPLTTDLSTQDMIAPTQPQTLRALSSRNSEIVLAWDASIDNIGVSRYDIMRNNVIIASSPFPAYIDSDVVDGTNYSYSVIAVDASGNPSVASDAAAAQISIDNTAPPTPVNVTFIPSADSIRISWEQQSINDVSSFEVLQDSVVIINTTSSFAYQADLRSGVQYCYQIVAVDGSGNKSAPTAEACTTTLQPGVQAPPIENVVPPVVPAEVPVVGVPTEGSIIGQWGGLMKIDAVDYPLIVDIEADGSNGFKGDFEYPTRTSCNGPLDFITNSGPEYNVNQRSRFSGGDCPGSKRVVLSLEMLMSELVLKYEQFDSDTGAVDYSVFLRSTSLSPEDVIDGSWGALARGPAGEDIPLLFNLVAGSGGTMTGDFDYPTLTSCNGPVFFVAKLDGRYEFYQRSRFSGGDCPGTKRLSITKSLNATGEVLEFESLNAETNNPEFSGTLQSRTVSSNDPIVGKWGGLVDVSSIDRLLEIDLNANNGVLSGSFDFPTRISCNGPISYVAKIEAVYEMYQRSRFSGGDCPGTFRLRLSLPVNGMERMLEYSLIDPLTNLPTIQGVLELQ